MAGSVIPARIIRQRYIWLTVAAIGLLMTSWTMPEVRAQSPGTVSPPSRVTSMFVAGTPGNDETEIAALIKNSLDAALAQAGYEIIDAPGALENAARSSAWPQFLGLHALNLRFLITGRVISQANGWVRIDSRLWDARRGEFMRGKIYQAALDHDRVAIADGITHDVLERLSGLGSTSR
jgi:hypothetical protein